jgi:crotonobetainyl-CoA:carnitine CoA-transferase CaiB-like acyl-CoA transferase
MPILDNILVVDLSRALAGPYCTMLLGDMGATVLKIEEPCGGDDSRLWGPPFLEDESAYFLSINRNKKSLTLNLKNPQGIEILKKLILKADILVENFKPGTMKKMGLDYESVHKLNPSLIYCSISGFGQTGPYAGKPGYDLIAQGMGGLMGITGVEGKEPVKAGVAIADIGGGMFGLIGILAALYARQSTGQGQWIDVSLFEGQISWMTYQAESYLLSGENPPKLGSAHPTIAPYQAFKTQDIYINIAVGNDKLWSSFCQALNKPEWIEDARFKNNALRVQNRPLLVNLIEEVLQAQPGAYWLTKLEEAKVPAGPVYSMAQIFSDPQTLARNMLIEMEHPKIKNLKLVGSPIKFSSCSLEFKLPPPLLGEHTEEILKVYLNLSPEEINSLKENQAI